MAAGRAVRAAGPVDARTTSWVGSRTVRGVGRSPAVARPGEDLATDRLDEGPDDEQPDARALGPAAGVLRPVEQLEQLARISGQARQVPFCPRRGKKKCHTLKSQVVVDVVTQQILATAHTPGSAHDLTLLRAQNPHLRPDVWVVADSGYQGLAKAHPQTCLRRKKPRGKELGPDDKTHNRLLGRFRMPVEHVIRSLKIWRIVVLDKAAPSGPVRNPIEGIWRKLKGFLMPRRCYNSLAELNAALKLGLKALNVSYV